MSTNEIYVTLQSLLEFLYENREIEFSDRCNSYFAEPIAVGENEYQYRIWDTKKNMCIFQGNPDALISFTFTNGYTIKKNFDAFVFSYIL